MRFVKLSNLFALGLLAVAVTAHRAVAQNTVVSVNEDNGSVDFALDDGRNVTVRVADGKILVNGNEVAAFDGNSLRERWRQIVSSIGRLDNDQAVAAVGDWDEVSPDVSSVVSSALTSALLSAGVQQATAQAVAEANLQVAQSMQERARGVGDISRLLDELQESDNVQLNLDDARIVLGATEVERGQVISGDLVVLGGEIAVKGTVTGNILAFGGDVRLFRGASVGGDVVSVDGTVTGSTSLVSGQIRSIDANLDLPAPRRFARFDIDPEVSGPLAVGGSLVTLLATLIAFSSIGFGLTFLAPRQLDRVVTRVTEHPGRSFLAGLFAQPLLLPLTAMAVVGLAVSIVGVVLIPFAVIALVAGVCAFALMGYLAVARSLGAKHARQRAERLGTTANPTDFESMIRGLVIVMAVWLPAVLLSWVPFAGIPVAALALLFTWVIATAGFGAVITTRAGFDGQLPWQRRRQVGR